MMKTFIKFTQEHEDGGEQFLTGVVYRLDQARAAKLIGTGKAYDVATGPPKKVVQRKAGRPPRGETAAKEPQGEER